jgi:hypothetical protein
LVARTGDRTTRGTHASHVDAHHDAPDLRGVLAADHPAPGQEALEIQEKVRVRVPRAYIENIWNEDKGESKADTKAA